MAVPAAMPPTCMEEKTLVMEKALARSTRKVSLVKGDHRILLHPPIVFGLQSSNVSCSAESILTFMNCESIYLGFFGQKICRKE